MTKRNPPAAEAARRSAAASSSTAAALRRWLGWLWRGPDRCVRPAHISQEAWEEALFSEWLGGVYPGGVKPRRRALLRAIWRHCPPATGAPLLVGAPTRGKE